MESTMVSSSFTFWKQHKFESVTIFIIHLTWNPEVSYSLKRYSFNMIDPNPPLPQNEFKQDLLHTLESRHSLILNKMDCNRSLFLALQIYLNTLF